VIIAMKMLRKEELAIIMGIASLAFFLLSIVLILLRELAASLLAGLFGFVLLTAVVNMLGRTG